MKSSKLITQLIAIVITVLAGVAFAAANNWTPPTGIPPAGNVDAPVNTSGTAQEKLGGLILGSGLGSTQSALYIPSANLLLGSPTERTAPNGQGGNVIANDIYITSASKWASTLTASAPAPTPTPTPTTCTATDWSPAVTASNVCAGSVATQIKTNADCTTSAQSINGTKDCSAPPAPTGPFYTPGEWFTDKVVINYIQADPDYSWATMQEKSFTAPHAISKVRLRGYTDDGGYCYAYWGTGHMESVRLGTTVGYYNVDGSYYPKTVTANVVSTVNAGRNGCPAGTVQDFINRGQTEVCRTYACPAGSTKSGSGGISGIPQCSVDCPYSFDDNGNAKLCQVAYGNGALTTVERDIAVPTGGTITVQGRHTIGNGNDGVNCALDIQYAP